MSALDKKEALLVQLRNMNDEAAAGMHVAQLPDGNGAEIGASGSSRFTPSFRRAYAAVVMQVLFRAGSHGIFPWIFVHKS